MSTVNISVAKLSAIRQKNLYASSSNSGLFYEFEKNKNNKNLIFSVNNKLILYLEQL